MKISMLVPDLSSNCLGRAYFLYKLLIKKYNVEIIGPLIGKNIWNPVSSDKSINYRPIKFNNKFVSIKGLKKIYDSIDGDLIYVVKPRFTSFNIGLVKKIIAKKPLILDIDDWELGFFLDIYYGCNTIYSKAMFLYKEWLKFFLKPWNSFFWTLINERLLKFTNDITVSSTFLKIKFGGIVVYHGRDTNYMDPKKFRKGLILQKYKLPNIKTVMFLGTPRPYKGLEDLIKAIYNLKDINILLVLVGVNIENNYCKDLIKFARGKLNNNLRIFKAQSIIKAPELLAAADVVVVPQRKCLSTVGQVPAKIFDAMSMAKPIISTNVSDIPVILNNCGYIVEPGNIKELSNKISIVFKDLNKSKEMGLKARDRCIKFYSYDNIYKILDGILMRYG